MQSQQQQAYEHWLARTTGDLHDELAAIKNDPAAIEDRFYTHLAFGTAGLRGVLGAGTNRMNVYTVRRASLGFANYLNAKKSGNSVVVSYDSRHFSDVFAQETAAVFAGCGIKTYLFKTLMPTPVCSYAIRRLGADAGVMITASHNPKIYNGYKAYGVDGCQIDDEIADGVLAEIGKIEDYFSVKTSPFEVLLADGKIEYISDSVYEGFIQAVMKLSVSDGGAKKVKIVYSPLNGTGNLPVRDILERRGFADVKVVPEQELPDGEFTTCPYPNPEIKEALSLAIKLGEQENADLVLATDPDCDRVGIAVRHAGEFRLLSGNEVGILLCDYLLRAKKERRSLPDRPVVVRTIVTNDVVDRIVKDYGGEVRAVLTGFKYIGGVITELEEKGEEDRFVLGFEESYGYMSGGHVRDKDAVNASMLIAEMCDYFLGRGKTLYDALIDVYERFGYFKAVTKSIAFEGVSGLKDMQEKMSAMRASPLSEIAGRKVLDYRDYAAGVDGLPPSNVLLYEIEDAKVIARPSGTEPKLKIYVLAHGATPAAVDAYVDELLPAMQKHFK